MRIYKKTHQNRFEIYKDGHLLGTDVEPVMGDLIPMSHSAMEDILKKFYRNDSTIWTDFKESKYYIYQTDKI